MKHKTADLDGANLDAAVAMAEGYGVSKFDARSYRIEKLNDGRSVCVVDPHPGVDTWYVGVEQGADTGSWLFNPSVAWAIGGPILERERMDIEYSPGWIAWCGRANRFGETILIAAMRAYVASKFGDEVELP